jgi:two-component system C4-dicarboxylate transport response regulator DctD
VAEIRLPPLRERREDIPLLFQILSHRAALAHGREPRPMAEADLGKLVAQDWPGNVRQLRNAAERFALGLDSSGEQAPPPPAALQSRLAEFEKSQIEAAFAQAKGDVSKVMEMLDMPRRTLNEKMAKYGIDRRTYSEA